MKLQTLFRSFVAGLALLVFLLPAGVNAQRLPPDPPPGVVHLILQLDGNGLYVLQGEVTVGERMLTIWDRTGAADQHVYKIVRISPASKKRTLLEARANDFDNVVTTLKFKVGYHYDVRVKDTVTGESWKLRLEVPEAAQ